MKCPDCDGGKKWTRVIDPPGRYDEPCSTCHHGWLPFWTPAERAGINVMGRHYKYLRSISPIRAASVRATIRAYVAASRRAKEKK